MKKILFSLMVVVGLFLNVNVYAGSTEVVFNMNEFVNLLKEQSAYDMYGGEEKINIEGATDSITYTLKLSEDTSVNYVFNYENGFFEFQKYGNDAVDAIGSDFCYDFITAVAGLHNYDENEFADWLGDLEKNEQYTSDGLVYAFHPYDFDGLLITVFDEFKINPEVGIVELASNNNISNEDETSTDNETETNTNTNTDTDEDDEEKVVVEKNDAKNPNTGISNMNGLLLVVPVLGIGAYLLTRKVKFFN